MSKQEPLDWKDAQNSALRTENDSESYERAIRRVSAPGVIRLLHAALGLATESGEFADGLKRHIFYGTTLDRVNLFEEGGDISWYLRIAADSLSDLRAGKCSFEEMVRTNIAKLRNRFPDKFSEEQAITRDLDKERTILEDAL